jgi:hypothetical protein
VDATFANGEKRSFRFDARAGGKGSLLLLDRGSSLVKPAEASEAKWTQGEEDSVTFSGAVEFPVGNVGRDRGTLVFKGKFAAEGSITGEAAFFPLGQEPESPGARPSRTGTFTANRVVN